MVSGSFALKMTWALKAPRQPYCLALCHSLSATSFLLALCAALHRQLDVCVLHSAMPHPLCSDQTDTDVCWKNESNLAG